MQERTLKARSAIGCLVPDLMKDFEESAANINIIRPKYSDHISDIFTENLKYIGDIGEFYRWMNIDRDWMLKSPYVSLGTFNTFLSLYRVNEEGWVIIYKLLKDLLNKNLHFT